jgi:hypothetical protein
MEEYGGAAPNPAKAKERSTATALRPPPFQSSRAEAAVFDPDLAAIDRFMVQRLRVRMAETQQLPPLSRIMLARGRRFASSTHPE